MHQKLFSKNTLSVGSLRSLTSPPPPLFSSPMSVPTGLRLDRRATALLGILVGAAMLEVWTLMGEEKRGGGGGGEVRDRILHSKYSY